MFKMKKLAAVAAAAVMATSAMAANVGMSVSAANAEPSAVSESASPRYAYSKSISFGATSTLSDTGNGSSTTVRNAPARIGYRSCSVGAAELTIYVNGSVYNTYVIPASAGTTIYHDISCSAGDRITYKVEPYYPYNHCVRTTGSFTLYY